MKTRWLFLGGGLVLGVALVLAGFRFAQRQYTYRGSLIDPPAPATDFELTDQNGQRFRLSDQQGDIVLLFFGYTHCPDVCPVTLSHFQYIQEQLGDGASEVRFVFVTVDPERDNPERLKTYLSVFNAGITGLTESRVNLEPVWKAYGVYQAKQELGSAAGYLVDHTARTYLIDRQGNWRLTYPFEMDQEDLLADVRHLLATE